MSPDASLDPAVVAQRQFATARRGLDAGEVRTYLQHLAEQIEQLQHREGELLARLMQAESRAEAAERLDEHRLVELLGEETTRVLAASRAAAADIKHKAQESAARLISQANEEAHQIRTDAESAMATQRAEMLTEIEGLRREAAGELDRRRAEAAEVVAQLRLEAETECEELRRSGEQTRQGATEDAKAIRAEAQEEGRQMVAEAQLVRERILRDLARRRRIAREQLERLHAARDRLLAAYEVVRRTVAEATTELRVALPEAKIAGDQARRRVHDEAEPTVDELEAQVSMARIAGLLEPLDGVVESVVESAATNGSAASRTDVDSAQYSGSLPGGAADPPAGQPADHRSLRDPSAAAGPGADDDEISIEPVVAPEVDPGPRRRMDPEPVVTGDEDVEVTPTTVPEPEEPAPATHPGPGPSRGDEPEPGDVFESAAGLRAGPSRGDEPEPGDVAESAADGRPGSDGSPMGESTSPADSGHPADRAQTGDRAPSDLVDPSDEPDPGDRVQSGDTALARHPAPTGVPGWPGGEPDTGDAVDTEQAAPDTAGASTSSPDIDELFARLREARGQVTDDREANQTGPESAVGIPTGPSEDSLQVNGDRASALTPVHALDRAEAVATTEANTAPTRGGDRHRRQREPEHDAADADVWLQQRDEVLRAIERDLGRLLKRALADEQNEVLDLLRRTQPTSADDLLPSATDHAERYADAARDELEAAANWGAIQVAAAEEPQSEGFCDVLAAELAQAVVEPLRERIERSFVDTGGDIGEVTGRLRALYREWKGQRIADAVRHFSVAAYTQGAYAALPSESSLRWLVDRSGDPCPDADDNALAGLVCKGEPFPTGDRCPPAHPGCRCLVVPESTAS